MREVLQREFDYRFDRQHLKAAKELVNPVGVQPLDVDIVKWCVLALRDGDFGFDRPVTSLYVVTWGDPPFYQQMVERIKSVPPPYQVRDYDGYVEKYGKKALSLGYWDGRYFGWENPHDKAFRMSPQRFIELVLE